MKMMTNLDMMRNQIMNGVVQNVTTDPTTKLKQGWLIYNTVDDKLKFYNGTQWVSIGTGGGASIDIDTSIDEHSTNADAAGAKAVYDFVTGEMQDIRSVTNGKVLKVGSNGDVEGIEIDSAVTENSTKLITSGLVFAAIQSAVSAFDAMKFKGTVNAAGVITSTDTALNNKNITTLTEYKNGWTFKASATIPTSVLGTDKPAETGDMIIICGNLNAYDATKVSIIQGNVDGVVVGPASATDETIAIYDGVSGKSIKASIITKTQLEGLFTDLIDLEAANDADDVYLTSSNVADNTIVKPGQTISAKLKTTGVTADTYGDNSGNASGEVDDNDTFVIPKFTVDAKGRITSAGEKTITLKLGSKGTITRKTNPAISADLDAVVTWVIDDIALSAYPSVQVYETSSGELVLTDVEVDLSDDEISIIFRNSANLTAGLYTAVIVS